MTVGRHGFDDVLRRALGVLSCVSCALAVGLLRVSFIPLLESENTVTAFTGALVQGPPASTMGGEWVHLSDADGFSTSYMHNPGSKMIGLRGSTVVDYHISNILNAFLNTTRAKEWISFLEHIEEHPTPKRNKQLIYQLFRMPWPLGEREFLMERTVEVDRQRRVVLAHYQSVDHPIRPQHGTVVRGETQGSVWTFKSLGNGKTYIEVESQVNPKLPVSGWVIKLMQQTYQRASMMQLMSIVKKTHPHPEYAHW